MSYPTLFSPLAIGPVTVPNRLVFAAHLTNFADGGLPTSRHAAYYAARAAGGTGLVVTEEHSVSPDDGAYEKLIRGWDPAVLPRYRQLTAAVHAHGVPVFAQLNHNGGQGSGLYTRRPVLAPSPVPDPLFGEVPRELTVADVAAVVAGFAAVAERCVLGGFDGVEVQASQSSLLRAFLSRATNRRADAYGGSLDNRARLLREVLAAVREAIGPGRALGVRLAGEEYVPHGTTLPEAVETARLVAPLVDYVNTTAGVATATLDRVVPPMTTPPGRAWTMASAVAAAIRAAVDVPVIAVGRFLSPAQAEQALRDGVCDLVGVVRGQLADPQFGQKARSGRADEIRTCLGCNQECVARVGRGRWIGCVQNPRAGREELPVPALRSARRVLVVGAGPAGLRAAAIAAGRGHRVTLVEKKPETGGALRLAGSAPGRAGLLHLVRTAEQECRAARVDLRLATLADADLVAALAPDVVVLATGAQPVRPAWAGARERVVDVRDVLSGHVRPRGEVLVVDDLGTSAATSVAELLAERGCAVEVMTAALAVGEDLAMTLDLPRWQARAAVLGIRQTTVRLIEEVRGGDRLTVTRLEHPTGARETVGADWVVLATHARPADQLWHDLAGTGPELHRIGDCLAPRRAHAATIEAERVALTL